MEAKECKRYQQQYDGYIVVGKGDLAPVAEAVLATVTSFERGTGPEDHEVVLWAIDGQRTILRVALMETAEISNHFYEVELDLPQAMAFIDLLTREYHELEKRNHDLETHGS